jgi:hypothetical protein
MRRLIRDAASIAAGLLAAVLCAIGIRVIGMVAIASGFQAMPTIVVARVGNLILVPVAAGLVIGAFRARRPVVLAVLLVVVSLIATYRSLGPAGLPHGWKIVVYLVQTVIVASAAIWMRHRRTSMGGPWGSAHGAGGLSNVEADKRSDEARFARHDPTRLQLS